MLLWGGVGAGLGLFVQGRQAVMRWGLLYGISLLSGFFVSRLAVGTRALHNALFVALAIILTPVGALMAVSAGSIFKTVGTKLIVGSHDRTDEQA